MSVSGSGIGSFSLDPLTANFFKGRLDTTTSTPFAARVHPHADLRGVDIRPFNAGENEFLLPPRQVFKSSYVAFDPAKNIFMLDMEPSPHLPYDPQGLRGWSHGGEVQNYQTGGPERVGKGALRGLVRAFHGSPHNFEKFDASKLGSGEGVQVFGDRKSTRLNSSHT